MRSGKWARPLFVVIPIMAVFAAGCGDFWQAPSTSTTCTTNCTTASSSDFYILNAGSTPGIVGLSIASGTLTDVGSSVSLGDAIPYSMAIAPNGDFLMVSTTTGVLAFPVTNGVVGTAVAVTQDLAYSVAVDATDSWLIEAVPGTGGVGIFAVPIDSTTGANNGKTQPVTITLANAAVQTNKMVISPDNANIFVALGPAGTIVLPFNAGVASGSNPLGSTYTPIPVLHTSGEAYSVAVDSSTTPRLFYIGEYLGNSGGTSGGLRVFNYSSLGTSALTQVSGSPFASGGLSPNYILPDASGDYVYVANGAGPSTAGNITGFTITASGTTYSVASTTSTAAGVLPLAMAEDSTGTFVFEVGSSGSPYFDAYTFDTTTAGQLDSEVVSNTAASSIAIVAAP